MVIMKIAGVDVPAVENVRPEDSTDMPAYMKQIRKTEVLPRGWRKADNKRPLEVDTVFDQNITIELRDSAKVYADVFRPDGVSEKVPAILGISPYGKGGHGFEIYNNCPYRIGLPENKFSGLEKFEFIDPAEWVPRGYAVVNVDSRGSWESDGDLYIEGTQSGRDTADVINFIAAQDWCNGSIGMAGNSWLATTQWSAAANKPPGLKCIAPWEGFTDMYRDNACRGGIPNLPFLNFIFNKTVRGRGHREDIVKALQQFPLINEYWKDKIERYEEIHIPIYAVASYSSAIHPMGTIRGYLGAPSKNKWLRFHSTHEWYDLYRKENNDDLQKFYDKYLKGIDNDWESTPPVRVSILTYHKKALDNRPYSSYPPKETNYRKLYLSQSTLREEPLKDASSTSYQADDIFMEPADFKYIFDNDTTIVGFSKVKLWVSCDDTDDLDIYLSLRKANKNGKVLEHINLPWKELPADVKTPEDVPNSNTIKHFGPTGVLRVSHRTQDSQRSTDIIPFYLHDKEDKVPPGTIVPVEIGFWPAGIHFEAGEALVLRARSTIDQAIEFPDHIKSKPSNLNKGKHTFHHGGKYDSYITVPVVPLT